MLERVGHSGDGWVASACGVAEEGPFLRWTIGVDTESEPVYHHVVVEPAQCGEVVWIVGAAVRPETDVVNLEAVARVAPGNRATAIAMGNESAHLWWNVSACVRGHDGPSVRHAHQLDSSSAQEALQHGRPDARAELDLAVGFTVRLLPGGIDEDGDEGLGP